MLFKIILFESSFSGIPNAVVDFTFKLPVVGGFEARVVFWYCLPPNPLSTVHSSIREFFSGTAASNRRELHLHLNVVPTGVGVFKSRHILLHKYVNRIMITYLWRQIQLIIPSHRFRSITILTCFESMSRDCFFHYVV
jgi:hypothetical protein